MATRSAHTLLLLLLLLLLLFNLLQDFSHDGTNDFAILLQRLTETTYNASHLYYIIIFFILRIAETIAPKPQEP